MSYEGLYDFLLFCFGTYIQSDTCLKLITKSNN